MEAIKEKDEGALFFHSDTLRLFTNDSIHWDKMGELLLSTLKILPSGGYE
jgi:hypothetical protein